jgi:hypothetical protein
MSTDVAVFENERDGRSRFVRYCGGVDEMQESGSRYRQRLQISLPHNTMSFTCEEAMELAQKLTEAFPMEHRCTNSLFHHVGDSDGQAETPQEADAGSVLPDQEGCVVQVSRNGVHEVRT